MLRQLISKWGIMSIDLQKAIDKDMAVIQEDGSADYVENAADETITIMLWQNRRLKRCSQKRKHRILRKNQIREKHPILKRSFSINNTGGTHKQ